MLNRDWKLRALRRVLGREAFQRGDEFVFFCPRHSHHKPKLNVNLRTDRLHCWVCGFKGGNLKPVLYLNGKTEDAERYSRELEKADHGADSESPGGEVVYDTPVLPGDFRTLSGDVSDPYRRAAQVYLRGRGVGGGDILRYKLGHCFGGKYTNRVIFPSFDSDGELNFFVGRKVYDEHPGPTYLHGNFDKDVIFNDYLIDWDRGVTLVEGPFDAVVVGDNAIPLLGKELREDSLLFRKIVTSGVPVTLALDADAFDAQWRIADTLLGYGVSVRMVFVKHLGFKDVGEMTREQFDSYCPLAIDSTLGLARARLMGMRA